MARQVATSDALGIVGRDAECAALDNLVAAAARGESGVLVLRGEAGMGKSALLGYAGRRATALTVLTVTGVELESDLDFAGLHGLVRPIEEELPRVPKPQRHAVAAALGLGPAGGADRFLVSAGVLSLLSAAADSRPLLCLIDDAQWLDLPSAGSLVFTARRLTAEGIAMVFAAREGERRRFEAPGLPQLMLRGLDRESARRLLAHSAPNAAGHVQDRLRTDAAGNPLALLELPNALSEEHLTGRSPLPEALPLTSGLRAAFMLRIAALPDETRTALLVAAAEDSGEMSTLAAALTKVGLTSDVLDPADEAGLIDTAGDRLTFHHPLVRAAVYHSATRGSRKRVHTALSHVLSHAGETSRAVWHRSIAAEKRDAELADALEELALQSSHRGGPASAASALERAAELSVDPRTRGRRLFAAAEAAWSAGQIDRARELIRRSQMMVDQADRGQLLHLRGLIEGHSGSLQEAVMTLREAARHSDDPSLTLGILADAATMAGYAGDYDSVIEFGDLAENLPCKTELDRFVQAAIVAYALSLSSDHQRGAAFAARAVEIAGRLDDPGCLLTAAITASRHGIAVDGLAIVSRAVEVVRERALVSLLPLALQAQARELVSAGRFDLCYSAAEEGWRLALDIGQPWTASINLSYLAILDAFRGAEELVTDRTESLEELVARTGAKAIVNNIASARAVLELGLGRPGTALDEFLPMLAATRPESDPNFALGIPDAVEAAARTGRLEEISVPLARFERWARAVPTPARAALMARCRALIDDADGARHFAEAVKLSNALSPFDRARTELLYGEWLRRHRQRADARPHLRTALDLFRGLSARPWEERAQRELRASGETVRRRDPSTRDELTPQELQIARLVAGGSTNPEVAAQLFLSPRTIDYHLRKVFVKLDISSRAEIAQMPLGEPLPG